MLLDQHVGVYKKVKRSLIPFIKRALALLLYSRASGSCSNSDDSGSGDSGDDSGGDAQATCKGGRLVGLGGDAGMMSMAVGGCLSRDAECSSRWLFGFC